MKIKNMELKKLIIPVMVMGMLLGSVGCSKKTDSADAPAGYTVNEGSDAESDLYQEENKIFESHKELWDKVFGLVNKNEVTADEDADYGDFLASIIEKNKDSFKEDEIKTLNEDIKKINEIEAKISKLEKESKGSDSKAKDSDTITFPEFEGKDLNGKAVDSSLFAKNKVTVVNFWFNGCKPCVNELSKLDQLNKEIKSMGGEVVGINSETLDGNKEAIDTAKKILKSKGATYKNIYFDSSSEAGIYAMGITAFPTTILVDKDGNIVGEPILGGIDDEANYNSLLKQIKSIAK